MDIPSPESAVNTAFSFSDRLRDTLFRRWEKHSNRRSLIFIILFGCLTLALYLSVIRPPERFPIGELVTVESGKTLSEVAHELEESAVVRSDLALRILVTLMGAERDVHIGDYLFQEPKDLFTIARALATGAYGLEPIRIRIPEGATTRDMAAIFATRLARFDRETFLLSAKPLEGYLFPDTYFFLPNASEKSIVEALRQNFDTNTATIEREVTAFGKPFSDVVIMASLLEREAHNTKDRRMIAGVLWNRLKRGMLLQVDAAFRYTTGKGTFDLTLEDLASDSPYNTYKHPGLPPTPIGSPSLDSILAAVTPVEHSYLYYLADRNGVTHYAKTYAEHLRNKQRYLN
jgi:UPF0755 protein